MRLLKNALLSSALALSMANADGAELNHAAMSLSEPAHGIVLSGGTSLPPLPDDVTSYASINNPDTPLTFEQIKNNLPGVFFNMADGEPRPETLVIIHKQEDLPVTGGAGDADKIRDFLWEQPGLKALMGSRTALRDYIDNTTSVIKPKGSYSEFNPIIAIPYSAARLRIPETGNVINMMNLSNESGLHHHVAGVPSYTSLSSPAQSYHRHFRHAHEFAHTHLNTEKNLTRGFNPLASLELENYADGYGLLDTLCKMYSNGISKKERDDLTTSIIELRNTGGLITLRSDSENAYHTHDADITILATTTLFNDNPDVFVAMSDKARMSVADDLAQEVVNIARQDYKKGNRTAFLSLTASEREDLAKQAVATIAEKYNLVITSTPTMPDIMQESIVTLDNLGFTHLTSHNPNNPADPGRVHYRKGDQEQPYMLVENHLINDSGNVMTSLEIAHDSQTLHNTIVDANAGGELPKERKAFEKHIRDAFVAQGLAAPSIMIDKSIEGHVHATLTMPATFDDASALPRMAEALKHISKHPDITPSISPTASPLTMRLLDNGRHIDSSILNDPELLSEAARVLFPDDKQITFVQPDKGAPEPASSLMPGPPLFLINEAKELRNEWLDEKRELIDKMRPRP